MARNGKRAIELAASSGAEDQGAANSKRAAAELEDESSRFAVLADELLVQILRAVSRELRADEAANAYSCRTRWSAALRNAYGLRAVCKRFKAEIDAAGGPLALFESAGWDPSVERWLAGRPGGVDAFLAERAPRLTNLREVTVVGGAEAQHGARFLAALPCWPFLVSLRLLSLLPTAVGELRACSDALAAVPAGAPNLELLSFRVDSWSSNSNSDSVSEEAAALVGAIVRRCASSLRTLELSEISSIGRWGDVFPSTGLRELRLLRCPDLVLRSFDPVSARPELPPPPEGSFPALRTLALEGPSTLSDWWVAVLASSAGAALQELSLDSLDDAERLLEALHASGPPPALRALSLARCPAAAGAADAPRPARLAHLLARLPALETLSIVRDDECGEGAAMTDCEGSWGGEPFPALRALRALRAPSGWWAAALASPAGARLERLSLASMEDAGRLLGALRASGSAPALRSLSLRDCWFEEADAASLLGLVATLPALQKFVAHDCIGVRCRLTP
eukprot:tig00020610_g12084.t1